MMNYKVVKEIQYGIKGYVIMIPYSRFFGLVKGFDKLEQHTETWAGTYTKIVFYETEQECHDHMSELELLKNWELN